MANLETQRKQVQVVINYPNGCDYFPKPLSYLETFLSNIGCKYAYIIHDKDVHEKDVYDTYKQDIKDLNGNIVHTKGQIKEGVILYHKGDLKTKHIHLVIESLKKHRLKVFLNYVKESLEIPENLIGVLPCDSLEFSIQYLIHKNDPQKYQYCSGDIKTNYSENVLCDYLDSDLQVNITTQDLIDICIKSRGNRIVIIQTLGLGRYVLYRNVINDIFRSLGFLDHT